jgi:hypothetical protein
MSTGLKNLNPLGLLFKGCVSHDLARHEGGALAPLPCFEFDQLEKKELSTTWSETKEENENTVPTRQ